MDQMATNSVFRRIQYNYKLQVILLFQTIKPAVLENLMISVSYRAGVLSHKAFMNQQQA